MKSALQCGDVSSRKRDRMAKTYHWDIVANDRLIDEGDSAAHDFNVNANTALFPPKLKDFTPRSNLLPFLGFYIVVPKHRSRLETVTLVSQGARRRYLGSNFGLG